MTEQELQNLCAGDLVMGKTSGQVFIVTANCGSRVTAVQTADLTNAGEWQLIQKSAKRDTDFMPPDFKTDAVFKLEPDGYIPPDPTGEMHGGS